jgi:SPASM domain peptide maturase of grasp-with-spasm system
MKYFKLFSNCIPVKGVTKSIVCDLQRNDIYDIPNDLVFILNDLKRKSLESVLEEYEQEEHKKIISWIDKLENEELGFYCEDPSRFPDLSLEFDTPELINNCIVEYGSVSTYNFEWIFKELATVGCKFLELRINKRISITELEDILVLAKDTNIRGIDVILEFQNAQYTANLGLTLLKHQRISRIIIHSIDNSEHFTNSSEPRLVQTVEKINNNLCCGNIGKQYFVSNVSFFTESQQFNNCLNKKLSISENGEIKNCPSMTETFGNVGDINFIDVLGIQKFKEKWNISKNSITTCKDCEYRYVCSDCRAYVEDPKDDFSKPLKCGYDPYEGKWSNWMVDMQKKSIFEKYSMKELC